MVGYMRSIASRQNKMEISGSSDEERGFSEKKLGSSDEIQAPIDDEVFHQTALASLTNDGADLTRVTLCDPQHAVAIAHYVDQFQENCESLKVVVTGVPGSGYSHIHDVEKVTAEPKSDNYIRKEDDYRVAVITVSFTLNSSFLTRIISWITFYSKIFKYNTIAFFLHIHTQKKDLIESKK